MVGRPGARYRPVVRIVSVLCALGVMYAYSLSSGSRARGPTAAAGDQGLEQRAGAHSFVSRHLLSYGEEGSLVYDDRDNDGDNTDNDTECSTPRKQHGYNSSCEYVRAQCGDEAQLFDYLRFILCGFPTPRVQWIGYLILILWLIYLISLLATTADNFFVPPLNLLSEKLRLSPSIAGITLLAIGNGAPDVFTAYAGLKGGDLQLVLGALIGASIFISTMVLGTIILLVKIKSDDIDKIDFVRDVTAYILVVALVVGVAYDGDIKLFEAVGFLLFYILYIIAAVAISFLRKYYQKRKESKRSSDSSPLLGSDADKPRSIQRDSRKREEQVQLSASNSGSEKEGEEGKEGEGKEVVEVMEKKRLELLGLTWPRESNFLGKIQFVVEWPISLLRWLSVPPCYYDAQWTKWHYWFVVVSPVPMATVLLVAVSGWSGFYNVWMGKLPIYAFLVMLGVCLSVAFFFLLRWNRPPHWSLQIVLGTLAFVMSIAWLNIEANEVVALLDAFGLLFNISTGILGLTVLAVGNSVGDWVADTAVARAGKPGMGIASCFGSPLLNDVLGLSIALMVKIGIYDHGKAFTFDIHADEFLAVKMSWIFLGLSLLSSVIIIPLFKFSPPKPYGAALIYLYVVFMVFSVLHETRVMNIDFLR